MTLVFGIKMNIENFLDKHLHFPHAILLAD